MMRTVLLTGLIVIGVASFCHAESSSASYTLKQSVMASGGAPASSASYQLNSTLGQPTPIGISSSSSYELEAGYWHTEEAPGLDGDVNGDCAVNILDLIYIRNRLRQDPSTGDNRAADINNDGAINILDLIYVRNRLGTRC